MLGSYIACLVYLGNDLRNELLRLDQLETTNKGVRIEKVNSEVGGV